MSDTTYQKFQHYGTNAERLAFTPNPGLGIQPIYIWFETDTGDLYVYHTEWTLIAGGSVAGITELTGDVTAGPGGGAQVSTIADGAVTNAKLDNMANGTIKGRVTAGAGEPEDLTGTEVTSLLDNFVGDSGAGGTKGLAPAPGAGDAAAGKYLKADGTWAVPAGASTGDVVGPASAEAENIALFDGTTGKLLKDSGKTIAEIIFDAGAGDVVGPASATNGNLAVFDGTTGKLIKDGGAKPTGDVTAAASIDDNHLVRGDGGLKGVQDTGITVDDSDNVTGINSVAVGGAAVANANATFNGQYVSPLVDDGNSGLAKTIDWKDGNEHYVVLTDNVTFTFSNPVNGGRYVLLLNTGAGSFVPVWPANVRWAGGTAPTVTATASKLDLFTFIYHTTLGLYFGSFNQNYNVV
jgi:hypothetical protein